MSTIVRHYQTPYSDRILFNTVVMRMLTLPSHLVAMLQTTRGEVPKDIGIMAVIAWVLGARVPEAVSAVRSQSKRAAAISKIRGILLSEHTINKKPRKNGSTSRTFTRERSIIYIRNLISEYFMADVSSLFRSEYNKFGALREEMLEGDTVLKSVLLSMENTPSLSHILPISTFSLTWTFVEFLYYGSTCDSSYCDKDFTTGDVLGLFNQLQQVSEKLLRSINGKTGCLSLLTVREIEKEVHSSASIYGREGHILKVSISNAVIVHLWKLILDLDAPSEVESSENGNLTSTTFLSYLLKTICLRKKDVASFQSRVGQLESRLSNLEEDVRGRKDNFQNFLKYSDALHCAVQSSVGLFKGPGVVYASNFQPDIVLERKLQKGRLHTRHIQRAGKDLKEIHQENTELSQITLSKSSENSKEDFSVHSVPNYPEITRFFYSVFKTACTMVEELEAADGEMPKRKFQLERRSIIRKFALGLFGVDCSGNMSVLYEDYIYAFFMRTFDEEKGVVKRLKKSMKKRSLVPSDQRKNISKKNVESIRSDPKNVEDDDFLVPSEFLC